MPDRDDKGRDERAATTTIDELANMTRDGFRNMLGELNGVRGELVGIRGEVHDISSRVTVVEAHLWPSRPPPPPPRNARPPSITSDLKDAHEHIAELSGRVIAAESAANEAKTAATEAKEIANTGVSINKQQSRAMGLAMPDASVQERLARLLISREGFKLLIGGIIAILSALGYASSVNHAADRAATPTHAVEAPR